MDKFRGRRNPRIRRAAMAFLDAALLQGLVAKWSYRWGWHGNLKVTSHDICLPTEMPIPAPLTVAFASDFHAGPTTHPEVYARLAQELIERQPDVVLLGGDFVSLRAAYVAQLVTSLSKYRPPLGFFAVLGNHDKS
jgi:predicted MPP superfamily phosphohydrolase